MQFDPAKMCLLGNSPNAVSRAIRKPIGLVGRLGFVPSRILKYMTYFLPSQNLFMLVSALMGLERMQAAYAHAIAAGYRFYSYGDASLLLPETRA